MDTQNLYTSGITNLLIVLTSLVTAIGVVWVNVIIAKAKTRVTVVADEVLKKADEIGKTTETTLGHVNSAATEMRAIIDALRHENEQLRVTANENRQIAAVLAARASPPDVPVAPAMPVKEALRAIEVNTGETASAVKAIEKNNAAGKPPTGR